MTQGENKILMDMSQQLGRIESDIQNIKNDVTDLKQADADYNSRLDDMYDKAMKYASARQDSIRDALQTQITQNTNDIAELKNSKATKLVYWWDLIVNKVIWAFIIAGAIVLLKWLKVPAEVIGAIK